MVLATAYANVVMIGSGGVGMQASAIYNAELACCDVWRFVKVILGLDEYMGEPSER